MKRVGIAHVGTGKSDSTGLADLDRATGGGSPGHLWVVGGSAGVGTTIFAIGLARSAALLAQAPVQWLSTREEPETLAALVLSAEARLTVQRLSAADLSGDERARPVLVCKCVPRHAASNRRIGVAVEHRIEQAAKRARRTLRASEIAVNAVDNRRRLDQHARFDVAADGQ